DHLADEKSKIVNGPGTDQAYRLLFHCSAEEGGYVRTRRRAKLSTGGHSRTRGDTEQEPTAPARPPRVQIPGPDQILYSKSITLPWSEAPEITERSQISSVWGDVWRETDHNLLA